MKASKEFLRKEGISETHPDFVAITQMLQNNTGYMYQFTRFRFHDQLGLVALRNLFNLLIQNRQILSNLEKDAASYRDYNELVVAIQDIRQYAGFNQFVQLCPSSLKDILRSNKNDTNFNNVCSTFIGFDKRQQRLFTSTISRYKTFAQLRIALTTFNNYAINKNDLGSTIDMISKTAYAHIRHIDFENNYLVARVAKKSAVVVLGKGTQWCISDKRQNYWNTYIRNDEDVQYVIYDFNKPGHSSESVIGLTMQGNKITHCHVKGNGAMSAPKKYFRELKYFDESHIKPADNEYKAEDAMDELVSIKNKSISTWTTSEKASIHTLINTGYASKLINAKYMSTGKISKLFATILPTVNNEQIVNNLLYDIFKKVGDTKMFNEFIPVLHNLDIKTVKKMKKDKLELKYGVHLDEILKTYYGSDGIMTTETKTVTRNGVKYRQTITLEPLNSLSLDILDLLISTNPKIASNKALTFAFRKNNLPLFKVILKHFTGKLQKVTQYNQIEEFRNELINSNKI